MTVQERARERCADLGLPGPTAAQRGRSVLAELHLPGLCLFFTISALLASVALPDSHALERQLSAERIERELSAELERFRCAVASYRAEHGTWPGADPDALPGELRPRHSAAWLARQLVLRSDGAGRCAHGEAQSYPFGPYLEGSMPVNAMNRLSNVSVLGPLDVMPEEPDDRSGWIYDPLTGALRANCSGRNSTGRRYYDL